VCERGDIDLTQFKTTIASFSLSLSHTPTFPEDICIVNEGVGILSLTNSKTAHAIPEAAFQVNEGDAILSCVEVM